MRITNQELLDNATIKDCIETLCTPDGVGTKMKQVVLDKYTQEITKDIRAEIRDSWRLARSAGSQLDSFRILERMVDRLGYGRIENNPRLDTL